MQYIVCEYNLSGEEENETSIFLALFYVINLYLKTLTSLK